MSRPGRESYWRRNLQMTAVLLTIWFIVTFVVSFYARELADIVILGFPLGFYMGGAQGAPIVYVLIIWWYARYMNKLDSEYGVRETDAEP